MYSIFQTPSHQKHQTKLYIYLQNCTCHKNKPAETEKLFIALISLVSVIFQITYY